MTDRTSLWALVEFALEILHPKIREELKNDDKFLAQWEIESMKIVSLRENGPHFKWSSLRHAFEEITNAPQGKTSIIDEDSKTWNLTQSLSNKDATYQIELGQDIINVTQLTPLVSRADIRVAWIHKISEEFEADSKFTTKWMERLRISALEEAEYDELISDIQTLPVHFLIHLSKVLRRKEFSFHQLISDNPTYFHSLAGSPKEATGSLEFIETEMTRLILNMESKRTPRGLRFALFSGTSNLITRKIDLSLYTKEEVIDIFRSLENYGDPISSISAIEAGLRQLNIFPELEGYIERLLRRFVTATATDADGHFANFSAIAIAVTAHMRRTKVFTNTPAFYIRHSALIHASLVYHTILTVAGINKKEIIKWISFHKSTQDYFLYALMDLREEPRWLPTFINAEQQLADFLGRAAISAQNHEKMIQSEFIRTLLIGRASTFITSPSFSTAFWPGPLEGAADQAPPCPNEIISDITSALNKEPLTSNSFDMLINFALTYRIPIEVANLASTSLKKIRFALDEPDISETISSLLGGLAIVAATTRSTELAHTLRVLTRLHRRRGRLNRTPTDELHFALTASAAFSEKNLWAQFAGDWITEIAFEVKEGHDSLVVLTYLTRLIQIEPLLAPHCSKAIAAVKCAAN